MGKAWPHFIVFILFAILINTCTLRLASISAYPNFTAGTPTPRASYDPCTPEDRADDRIFFYAGNAPRWECVQTPFFHLLAYYMTDDSVHIEENMIRIMSFMQTGGVIILIPLLLPFFIGSLLLAIELNKQEVVTRVPVVVFISALKVGPAGSILAKTIFGYTGNVLSLSVLGLIAVGQVTIGVELILDLINKKNKPIEIVKSSVNESTLQK